MTTTTQILTGKFISFPDEPKNFPAWVVWRYEHNQDPNGKPLKVPYNPRSPRNRARINDPYTWSSFSACENLYATSGAFDGLMFALSEKDPYTAIDLDGKCVERTGQLAPWAWEILDLTDSYTELSPSATGVHTWFVARRGDDWACKRGSIECYDRARFMTVTGLHVHGTPATLYHRQTELETFYTKYLARPEWDDRAPEDIKVSVNDMTDDELIDKALDARNGQKFYALFISGDSSEYVIGDEGQSRADLALCCMLMYWTGNDRARADKLFRQSGLMRPKWDERRGRSTYGERTLDNAVQSKIFEPKGDQ